MFVILPAHTGCMSDLACDYQHNFLIRSPGPRPFLKDLVRHVFGDNAEVNADGDSPMSADWTWLYMQRRSRRDEAVVEICMIGHGATALRITSEDKALAKTTADFLVRETGGQLIGR